MATERKVPAHIIINRVCDELGYTRSHVAKIMRENATKLGAVFGSRWMMPESKEAALRELVRSNSGPRYRLGERKAA